MSREITNRILEDIDEGILSAEQVVIACLKYMSEDDVRDMAECNELLPENYDLEEDY